MSVVGGDAAAFEALGRGFVLRGAVEQLKRDRAARLRASLCDESGVPGSVCELVGEYAAVWALEAMEMVRQ